MHFHSFPSTLLVRLDKEGRVWEDSWVNAVKEADFLRSGTGKGIMSLSKSDSDKLWDSVRECMSSLLSILVNTFLCRRRSLMGKDEGQTI